MATEQYFIVLHNNEWKISFKEKHYGPYATQAEAIEAAIDAAYAMGEIGIDARSLLRKQTTSSELSGPMAKALTPLGDRGGANAE
jgi:hypothetical protein